jgi:branched-chain amino acid transport system permease protein
MYDMGLILEVIKFWALLAVASFGLNLIYGVFGFINLAHSEFIVLGALTSKHLIAEFGLSLGIIFSVGVYMLVGIILSQVLFYPCRHQARENMIAVSLGLALIMQVVYSSITLDSSVVIRELSSNSKLDIVAEFFTQSSIGLIVLASLLAILLTFWLKKTRIGNDVLLVSEDLVLAEAWGIQTKRTFDVTFGLSLGLAALSGVLFASNYSLSFGFSFKIVLWSLCAILVGGLGNLKGGFWGALIVSVLWGCLGILGLEPYVDTLLIMCSAIIFVFRPYGLFGRKKRLL